MMLQDAIDKIAHKKYMTYVIFAWLTLGFVLLAGCHEAPGEQFSTLTVIEFDLSSPAPLSEGEVSSFLKLVSEKPSSQMLQFLPVELPDLDPNLSSKELAVAFENDIKARFDLTQQAILLSADRFWGPFLKRHHVAPGNFASLLLRISCALNRLELSESVDFEEQYLAAESKVSQLVTELEALERSLAELPTTTGQEERTRLMQLLQAHVAWKTYTVMLKSVPEHSCELVAAHQQELEPLLEAWHSQFDSILKPRQEVGQNAERLAKPETELLTR